MWSGEVTHVSGKHSGHRVGTMPDHCKGAVASPIIELVMPLHDQGGIWGGARARQTSAHHLLAELWLSSMEG